MNSTANRGKSNSTRVRDNQRRSRARQKEYIRELESKVQNYERLGVQASSEIQAAARTVLEENQRLRALLLSRDEGNDVTEEQVACEKHAGPQVPEVKSLQMMLDKSRCCGTDNGCTAIAMSGNASLQAKTLEYISSSSCAPIKKDSTSSTSSTSYPPQRYSSPPAPTEAMGMDRNSSLIQPPDAHDAVMGKKPCDASTPCAMAVSIITDMRADVDPDEVQEALGCCTSVENCKVDNSKLFSTLDQYAE